MEKIIAYRRGITFLRRKFLVSQWLNFSWGTLQCFRKFGASKNFLHIRRVSRFSVGIFLSHCAEKMCRAPSLFDRISGMNFFHEGDHGFQSGGGGGGLQRFCVETFLSHSTEKNRRKTFCVHRILVSKNFIDKRGGVRGCQDSKS